MGPTPHLRDLEIQQHTESRGIHYYRGRLEVTKQNSKEGYVTCTHVGDSSSTSPKRLFINQERGDFNRSFHHDLVVVQELPQSAWSTPVGRKRLIHQTDGNSGDDNTILRADNESPVPSGRVVAIQRPSRRLYVCTLIDSPSSSDSMLMVVPMDIRIPKIRISSRSWSRLQQKRFIVEVDSWDVSSNYPTGHVTQILGDVGDMETEILCLLWEHEISLEPFSKNAIACLPPLQPDQKWRFPQDEINKRRDLRFSHQIFSVDSLGCQDIDDTMHAKGKWLCVYVRIFFSSKDYLFLLCLLSNEDL